MYVKLLFDGCFEFCHDFLEPTAIMGKRTSKWQEHTEVSYWQSVFTKSKGISFNLFRVLCFVLRAVVLETCKI